MKIAFINYYQWLAARGAETFVRELTDLLQKKHSVHVFSGKKVLPARWPVIWRFFFDPQGLLIAWFSLKLIPRIWREKYDIVIPLNGGWQVAIVRIVTWLYGGKMVITGHSGMGWDDRNNLWSFPNVFIALSRPAESWAKKVNPFVKSVYIPNGVDTKKFKAEGEKINIDLKKPIILCVGALTKTKRIGLVIEAVTKLGNASLLVVGKGEEEEALQALGTRLLGNKFKITSFPYEKMPNVYRVADVFTLVSESYYSFENVLVEAMATNIPVVANNDPIRKEIVGDAGILVDPTNTNEYVEALRKAIETDWGNKPREQAKKFDWDKIALEYEKIIRSL